MVTKELKLISAGKIKLDYGAKVLKDTGLEILNAR